MHQIIAFYLLYLKMLLVDKINLIWTVIFPVVFALVYQSSFLNELTDFKDIITYISYFWVFIIMTVYINGIGLQLARIREYGLLKTYAMIAGNRFPFIISILLTQISFTAISLFLFTSIVSIYYRVFSLNLLLSSFIVLLASIPLAIASVSIASIPITYSNLSTIANILMYPLFILSFMSGGLVNYVNPFYIVHEIASFVMNALTGIDFTYNSTLLLLSILFYLFLGLIVMKRFSLQSIITR